MPKQPTPFDSFSQQEADRLTSLLAEIAAAPWAQPIIAAIARAGGVNAANRGHFFELRFGHALNEAGVAFDYEIPGEGKSTLDFGFTSQAQRWRIELMRMDETEGAKGATFTGVDQDGTTWFGRHLYSSAEDATQSLEGETLKAVQRICQKCERNGRPHKFPPPDGAYHVILVDIGACLHGSDRWDRIHIAHGGKYVQPGHQMRWEGKLITGVFDPDTPMHGAAEARQRVHFIGFVNNPELQPGADGSRIEFAVNPNLFCDAAAVRTAIATWPLQPATVL
jgi:hypothetical protein